MNVKTHQFAEYRIWSVFVCGSAYITVISYQTAFQEVLEQVLAFAEEQDAEFPGLMNKSPFFCLKADLIDQGTATHLAENELVNLVIGA